MTSNILYLFPHNPLPPASAAYMPELLPIIVPMWWEQWRVDAVCRGWIPKPAVDTVAELRQRMDKSPLRQKGRVGMVQNADVLQGAMAA